MSAARSIINILGLKIVQPLWNHKEICRRYDLPRKYGNSTVGEKKKVYGSFVNRFQSILLLVNGQRVKADIVEYNDDDDKAPKNMKYCPNAAKKAFGTVYGKSEIVRYSDEASGKLESRSDSFRID